MKATLTSKGQITLPIELRERLGLHKGDQVEFVLRDEGWLLRPVHAQEDDPFAQFVGILPSVGDVVQFWREMRDDSVPETELQTQPE